MNINSKIEKEFSTIILAAGKSERLGFPKLSLRFDDKQIFVEHIIREYINFGCNEIILVVNEIGFDYLKQNEIQFPNQVKIVINEYPDWHRFYSLKIGAKSLTKIHSVFIHHVDNPFANQNTLNKLLNQLGKADYIIPEFDGKGGHPFMISGEVVEKLKSVEENQMHLKDFLNQFSKMKVAVDDEKVLVNINSVSDYNSIFI